MRGNLFSKKYPNFTDIVLFFGLFFILSVISVFIKILIEKFFEANLVINELIDSILYVSIFILMLIIVSIYRRVKSDETSPQTIFRKARPVSPRYILWAIISIFSISITINPILELFSESLESIYTTMLNMNSFMLITCVFIAPVVEEILFRGIIQSDFQNKYGAVFSIIASSLIFAIIHIIPAQIISVFFTSLIIGLVYYKTNSLWSVIFIHFFNNIASVIIFRLYPDKESFMIPYSELIENKTIYYTIYTTATLITIFAIYKILTIKTTEPKLEDGEKLLTEEPTEENIGSQSEDIDEVSNQKTEPTDNNFINLNVNDEDNKI